VLHEVAGDENRREYLQALMGLRLLTALVAAGASLAFAVIAGYPQVMIIGVAISCVGNVIANLQATLSVVLVATLRIGWLALNDFLTQTVGACMMLVLVLLGASLLPFYATTTVAAFCALAVTAAVVRGQVSLVPRFDLARWRSLASDSLIYAAATALGVTYFQIVAVAAHQLTGAVQTGWFAFAFRVLTIVNALPWILASTAFPILTRAAVDDVVRLRHALGRLYEVGLLAGGVFTIGLVFGAPVIVTVAGGPNFHGAISVLRILGAGAPATWLVAVWAYTLLSLKAYRPLIIANGIAVLVAVGLCLVLIPAHGAQGASIVTAALEVILAGEYGVILMRRPEGISADPARTARIALVYALAFAAGVLVPSGSLARTGSALAVFALAVLVLGLFPAEFVAAIRSGGRSAA
jgi:O-antigen/teichoic acid export membrane protein